jgi:serine/threonine protein kinase
MNILSNYKIIKELGHGMMGTVYLIECIEETTKTNKISKTNKTNQKNKYALKIEHIEKKDLKPNNKSETWREINFYNNLGNKYPEQFIHMIEYDFIEDCEHKQKYSFDLNLFDKKVQNKIKNKASSNFCIRRVYDLVDGSLTQIIAKLEPEQIYSMIIQLSYSIKLLHQSNYIHGDLHIGNIGWIKTDKKFINSAGLKVKTFGYIYKLLDFGMVLSKSDISNKREERMFNESFENEVGKLKYLLINNDKFWDWFRNNDLEYDFGKLLNDLKKTKEFEIIKRFTSNWNDQVFLYEILFQNQFQKIICKEKYKKTIPVKLYVPIQDILVMVKISSNPDLVIKYFYDKI